jgi:hypothetical protein
MRDRIPEGESCTLRDVPRHTCVCCMLPSHRYRLTFPKSDQISSGNQPLRRAALRASRQAPY